MLTIFLASVGRQCNEDSLTLRGFPLTEKLLNEIPRLVEIRSWKILEDEEMQGRVVG
jgi:hypothetical protein